jgi:hypothetical protein
MARLLRLDPSAGRRAGRGARPPGEQRRVEGVAIVEAEIPRAWLRRNRRGLWFSVRDVPPERFRRVVTFAEPAGAITPAA